MWTFRTLHPQPCLLLSWLSAILGCQSSVEVLGPPVSEADAGQPDAAPAAVHADKVDLLFVVDNSASMGDKQQVLASAVPMLIDRLVHPRCVDGAGMTVPEDGPSLPCPSGSEREFPAVADLHIGVVTTSLGGHGADTCSEGGLTFSLSMEDMAHLISRRAGGGSVPTWQSKGFLNWDPQAHDTPPGESDSDALAASFVDLVRGAGEDGCGFEAPLEAWYRFLVDPRPYERMAPAPCYAGDSALQCRDREGVDQLVLQQRRDFLRQDSLVVIVMLTDENDCSVTDEQGQAYLSLQAYDGSSPFHLPPGTSACASAPSSPDCISCWQADPQKHPECESGWPDPDLDDPLNLRCFRQKQRFGIDFLYPVDRYVAALTLPNLPGIDAGPNPLFCMDSDATGAGCATALRDRSRIVLAGIIGVPWQDIAKDPWDLTKGFLPAQDVPWERVLGNLVTGVEPTDPLMVESVAERKGTNPATGAEVATSATPPGTPGANPINGFDRPIPHRNDLQYACIFDLPEPMDCTTGAVPACECYDGSPNPLCWDEALGAYGTKQFRAKAYPSRRQLAVLQGIGSQAVVSSICAGQLSNPSLSSYGYRPFVQALVERMRWNLASLDPR